MTNLAGQMSETYVAFDEEQCIEIETRYRKGRNCITVLGRQFPTRQNEDLKCMVEFIHMTAWMAGHTGLFRLFKGKRSSSPGT